MLQLPDYCTQEQDCANMKRIPTTIALLLAFAAVAIPVAAVADDAADSDDDLVDKTARRSYALGMDIGSSVGEFPVELDIDALIEGLRDTLGDGETRISEEEKAVVLQDFLQDIQSAQRNEQQQLAQDNLEASEEFLADNADESDVTVTDSGLQYKVLQEGDGLQPGPDDTVVVHYEGKLIDGTQFDSSYERGEPVTFPVNGVIAGWTQALQ